MLKSLNKFIHRNSEPIEQKPTTQPELRYIGPIFSNSMAIKSTSATLYSKFCEHCNREPELLAVKGTLCLLGCDRNGCKKKLFRIDT